MKISTNITPETHSKFHAFAMKRFVNKAPKYQALVISIFITSTLLSSWFLYDNLLYGIILASYSLLFLLSMAYVNGRLLKRHMSNLGDCMYGKLDFIIKDDYLEIKNDYFTKKFKYDSFCEMIIDKNKLYLMIGPASGFLITKDKWNNEVFEQFTFEIRNKINHLITVAQPKSKKKIIIELTATVIIIIVAIALYRGLYVNSEEMFGVFNKNGDQLCQNLIASRSTKRLSEFRDELSNTKLFIGTLDELQSKDLINKIIQCNVEEVFFLDPELRKIDNKEVMLVDGIIVSLKPGFRDKYLFELKKSLGTFSVLDSTSDVGQRYLVYWWD